MSCDSLPSAGITPVSSVLWNHPTPCSHLPNSLLIGRFDILLCCSCHSTCHKRANRVSRVAVQSTVNMPGSLTLGKFHLARHFHATWNVVFQFPHTVNLPDVSHFEALSLSGLLTSLSTLSTLHLCR